MLIIWGVVARTAVNHHFYRMKMSFHKLLLLCLALFLAFTTQAQSYYKTLSKDLQRLKGSWKGTLTYLDYTSGKPYTMPADVYITRVVGTQLFLCSHHYPDEPKANAVDTLRLSPDGKMIDQEIIRSRRKLPGGGVEIITEETGVDGNDQLPATFRYTYRIGKDFFSQRKDVQFAGQTEWIQRHEYVYRRNTGK